MKRITYFDEDLQEYRFADGFDFENVSKAELAFIIAKLEEHKELCSINSLADYIVSIRKAHRLTQEEFAKRICENRSTLANYEAGRCQPSIYKLRKISVEFGVPMQEIKSLYKRVKHDIDEDEVDKIFSESKDRKEIARVSGQLLKFEREFYGASKKDLAHALTLQQQANNFTRAHVCHPHIFTKIESGQKQLSWLFCEIIAQVLKTHFHADKSCLCELTQKLYELQERGTI